MANFTRVCLFLVLSITIYITFYQKTDYQTNLYESLRLFIWLFIWKVKFYKGRANFTCLFCVIDYNLFQSSEMNYQISPNNHQMNSNGYNYISNSERTNFTQLCCGESFDLLMRSVADSKKTWSKQSSGNWEWNPAILWLIFRKRLLK